MQLMRSVPVIISIFAVLLLAGCAGTLQNSLSQKEISNLRVDRVKVSFEPDAAVLWPKVAQAYVASLPPSKTARKFSPTDLDPSGGSAEDAEYAANAATPEAKAHLRESLAALIKSRVQRDVLGAFQNGARPAELRVRVKTFAIPSPIQRVLVGGQPALVATTTLHDVATGKQLALMKATSAAHAGQGLLGVAVDQAFSDMDDRVMSKYTREVHAWLLNRQ